MQTCLQLEECIKCFNKLVWAHTHDTQNKERAKALHAISTLPKFKFDAEPPDKLTKVLVTVYKICEMDDAAIQSQQPRTQSHDRRRFGDFKRHFGSHTV